MFDWSEYEKLARSLENGDEAAKRSSVSRLYYSIYHQAIAKLEEATDFTHSANKPAHQQVWERFIAEGKSFKAIGNKGRHLRDNRSRADYDPEIGNLDAMVSESFSLANAILYWLDKIQPAQ
jgi:uncharacterized protein (UPF0332 family)